MFQRHHGQALVHAAIEQAHEVAVVPRLERTQEGDFLVGAGDPALALARIGAFHLLPVDQLEGDARTRGKLVGTPDNAVGGAGQRLAQAVAARFECDDCVRFQHAFPFFL